MRLIKRTLMIFAVALVAGIAIDLGIFLTYKVLWIKEPMYITQGLAAFTGAAAAFIFTALYRLIEQLRLRKLRHYNALVQSEYLLNGDYLNIAWDNKRLIDAAIQSCEKYHFHILSFKCFEIDRNTLLAFNNLDLINESVELNVDLRRFNESFNTIQLFYADFKDGFKQGAMDQAVLMEHFSRLKGELRLLSKGVDHLENKIRATLCTIRILLREGKPLMNVLHEKRYARDHAEKVRVELKKLLEESLESIEESRKELEVAGLIKPNPGSKI